MIPGRVRSIHSGVSQVLQTSGTIQIPNFTFDSLHSCYSTVFDHSTKFLIELEDYFSARAHVQNPQESWMRVKGAARELLLFLESNPDEAHRQIEGSVRVANRVLLLDRVKFLLGQVDHLNRRTSAQFQGVVNGLGTLAEGLLTEVQVNVMDVESLLHNSRIDELQRQIEQLYALFLGKVDQIKGRCAAYSSTKDMDSVITHLIDMIQKQFIELIGMFQSKKWKDWVRERDKTQSIPQVSLGQSHVSSIEKGLEVMKGELELGLPNSSRTKHFESLQLSFDSVLTLKTQIFDLDELLHVVTTLTRTIRRAASSIKLTAQDTLKYFNKYCQSVADTVFWEFLPYEKHFENHVRKAEEYLAGRKVKTGLRLAHFVAAFDCLVTHF